MPGRRSGRNFEDGDIHGESTAQKQKEGLVFNADDWTHRTNRPVDYGKQCAFV